jgi:hypothetical protein
MNAIEITYVNGWLRLLLETNTKLVHMAFHYSSLIPWQLRNRWSNCLIC